MATFAGVQPKGGTAPTVRHDSGQTKTAAASSFTFRGESPKDSDPTGTFTLVNFLKHYMGDTLFGQDAGKSVDSA